MESFYKKWLIENKKANEEARKNNPVNLSNLSEQGESQQSIPTILSDESESNIPSTSSGLNRSNEVTNMSNTRDSETNIEPKNTMPLSKTQIVYENDSLQLTIEKSSFVRQKKFKLHDHLFHVKINLKDNSSPPFLRDILNFLQIAFDRLLDSIRPLYDVNDHNIAFLTLYQKPMINGLNTGGFDIQENSLEMVQRLLTMLEQFLVSNQSIKLDESFKVYIKVLSVQHMNYKQSKKQKANPNQARRSKFGKKVGSRVKPTKNYNYYWALDVPNSFDNEPSLNIFKDKCLLTGTILGLMQNKYFKSSRQDKQFLYVQYINSVNKPKQNRAGKILLKELQDLLSLCNLKSEGPYDLEETAKILSDNFKCQLFIFDTIHNSNKLVFMYPPEYDDSLIPIYFLQPHDAKCHLVYIRNLKSFFRARVTVCFGCKKTFLTQNYKHLCPKKQCCFSCRRFFQNDNTYIHEKLIEDFCDKNLTKEEMFTCTICNVTCYSKHCLKGHKRICNGQGTFGFKCLKCNKFTYRYGNKNGQILKDEHVCESLKLCPFCRESQELNHLCKLKKESDVQVWPKLAFIAMEYFDNSSENCNECLNLRTAKNNKLFCSSHKNETESDDEPILATIFYEENERGCFEKYQFDNFENVKMTKSNKILEFNYNKVNAKPKTNVSTHKKTNPKSELVCNLKKLNEKDTYLMSDKILQLIMTWRNTTFLCQDEDSISYVRFKNSRIIIKCESNTNYNTSIMSFMYITKYNITIKSVNSNCELLRVRELLRNCELLRIHIANHCKSVLRITANHFESVLCNTTNPH
jgi:hypothetical protein